MNVPVMDEGIARKIERRSRRTVFQAFLDAARKHGANKLAVIDGDGKKFTYKDLSRAAFALSGPIARMEASDVIKMIQFREAAAKKG